VQRIYHILIDYISEQFQDVKVNIMEKISFFTHKSLFGVFVLYTLWGMNDLINGEK
jgi:hypothetical protein